MRLSRSSASWIIFIATAVEEMESMKPITTPPITSPCTSAVNVPTDEPITATLAAVTPSASGSEALKAASRISMPMMNSSISTPRSARVSILAEVSIRPAPDGPSATPARMKPAAAGMRSLVMTRPSRVAAASTRATAVRLSCMDLDDIVAAR
jgi:hypothetical protein